MKALKSKDDNIKMDIKLMGYVNSNTNEINECCGLIESSCKHGDKNFSTNEVPFLTNFGK